MESLGGRLPGSAPGGRALHRRRAAAPRGPGGKALGLPGPLIVEYLINHLTQRQPINLLYILLAFVTVATAAGIVGFLLTITVTYLGQRFKYDMRRKLYSHMQTLSLGFFETRCRQPVGS